VHRGSVGTSAVVIEAVEQAAIDHGVERVGVAVQFGGVGYRERRVAPASFARCSAIFRAVGEMSNPVTG